MTGFRTALGVSPDTAFDFHDFALGKTSCRERRWDESACRATLP